jgi:hypothetical protein
MQRELLPTQQLQETRIDGNTVHQKLVGHAAARVCVEPLQQGLHTPKAITNHLSGLATRHCHHHTTTDKHTVVVTNQLPLDQLRIVGIPSIHLPGAFQGLGTRESQPDISPLRPISRFEHHGPADRRGSFQSLLKGVGDPLGGERDTSASQDLGQADLAMQPLGQQRRPICNRLAEQTLTPALSQLQQLLRTIATPIERNSEILGGAS